LRDPTFSRFDTIPACDRQTHRETHRHTDTRWWLLPAHRYGAARVKMSQSVSLLLCSLCTATVLNGSGPNLACACHPYTLRMVTDRLASAARARARRLVFRAPSIYAAANKWRAGSRRKGTGAATERRRREGESPVSI